MEGREVSEEGVKEGESGSEVDAVDHRKFLEQMRESM